MPAPQSALLTEAQEARVKELDLPHDVCRLVIAAMYARNTQPSRRGIASRIEHDAALHALFECVDEVA